MIHFFILTLGTLIAAPSANSSAGPRSPQESLDSFVLPEDLIIELVAAEPLVVDPVAITFDEKGRLYVVEYRDYPLGPGKGEPPYRDIPPGKPLSRIKLLEDTDGDGKMDKSHVFAEGMSFAQGLMAWKGGLLVTASSSIMFLKDTDGDHRADHQEILFEIEQKKANPQLRSAHPRWGLDNWIYITNGLGGEKVRPVGKPEKEINISRSDFRFHPHTLELEPATGYGQFGNTFDDWGNRFFCSNRNPTMHAILPHRAMNRNPYALITTGYEDAAPFGGDTKVYPMVEKTMVTAFSHTGTHTAACGVWVHRGDLLGPDYSGNVFVCEPTGHLVTRSILRPNGVGFTAERARPKVDFLTSTDSWCRPVSLADGPDGALYVIDMYRQVIEHPQFMVNWYPKEALDQFDFRAGDDRGRIYRIRRRIRRVGEEPRPFRPPKGAKDYVALLSDPNGWQRDLGQRLLIEEEVEALDAIPALIDLASKSKIVLARLHALCTLDGLERLSVWQEEIALRDPDHRVREHAVRLSKQYFRFQHSDFVQKALRDPDARIQENVRKLANRERNDFLRNKQWIQDLLTSLVLSNEPRIRFQLALALGEIDDPRSARLLTKLAVRDGEDPWISRAILTSVANRSGAVLTGLVRHPWFVNGPSKERIDFLVRLAGIVGARGDEEELSESFGLLGESSGRSDWCRMAILTGIAQGLPRSKSALGRKSLAKLLSDPPNRLKERIDPIRKLLDRAVRIASDESLLLSDRVAAIRLLGYRTFDEVAGVLANLLTVRQPTEVQLVALAAMRNLKDDRVTDVLLDDWNVFSPVIRSVAMDLFFAKTPSTRQFLEAIDEGRVNGSVVDLDRRTRLLRSGNTKIKELATRLFGGAISKNRREVIEKYEEALAIPADPTAGQQVFAKICAKCHKMDGEGHLVGPDISDVRNKTPLALLQDILDPNRAVEPRWTDYAVATSDGRVLSGLLIRETTSAIVLRWAEGKEEVIPRSQITELRATGKSLMPEGMEKELSVGQLADLIAFLKEGK